MKLGYNTNGFAHHRLIDAIAILADLGYQSVAITLDYHSLNPFEADPEPQLREIRSLLEDCRLSSVIETGSRYLLDPYRKHQPTLLNADADERAVRLGMLTRSIEYAHALGAEAVSFWSGTPAEGQPLEEAWQRLIQSCRWLSQQAAKKNVRLAFEPEPGMLVSRMEEFARLYEAVDHPSFGLTLDLGHVHCLDDGPIPEIIQRWRDVLWNVHLEDMRRGVHDHLMFGQGEMNFREIAQALRDVEYGGGVHVELSRHSHDAVNVAYSARKFLLEHGFARQGQRLGAT